MTWFFQRDSEMLAYEVRRQGSSYEIAVRRDGIETVTIASTPAELLAHLDAEPHELFADGWRPRR